MSAPYYLTKARNNEGQPIKGWDVVCKLTGECVIVEESYTIADRVCYMLNRGEESLDGNSAGRAH